MGTSTGQNVETTQQARSNRVCYLDVLNVIACFAVIMLHCSNDVFDNVGDVLWVRCAITQSAFIFAVPIFFMISGANLLNYRKRYDTRTFLVKRAARILPTFVGCSILLYIAYHLKPLLLGDAPLPMSFDDFAIAFMMNDIESTYWFFYTIIGLYLLTPLISRIADDASLLRYGIGICFVTSSLFPLIQRFIDCPNALDMFTYPFFTIWLMYYLLGYYLAHHFDGKLPLGALVAILAGCIIACAAITIYVNMTATIPRSAPYDSFFSNVWCPLEFAAICSLFLIFKQLDSRLASKKLSSIARKLSGLSLGIYAIHMLPLCLANASVVLLGESIFLKAVGVFTVSALVTWTWKKALATMGRAAKRN